jgi:hypothetical protein
MSDELARTSSAKSLGRVKSLKELRLERAHSLTLQDIFKNEAAMTANGIKGTQVSPLTFYNATITHAATPQPQHPTTSSTHQPRPTHRRWARS